MVNPVSSGVSSYPTSQPSFTSGAESRAVTDQVQPRQAPAAESQRGDQRLNSRDEDDRRVQARSSSNQQETSSSRRSEESTERDRRGGTLDVVV